MFDQKSYVERAATRLFGGSVSLAKLDASDWSIAPIKKFDDAEQLVWGEVYIPGYPDSQGDFMSPGSIKKTAYNFMKSSRMGAVDTNHDEIPNGSYIVENFIARKCDDIFIPDAWVAAVWVANDYWPLVKSGDLNGFSLDGLAKREKTTLSMDIPDILKGDTSEDDGHSHVFFVKYDVKGQFLGGQTSYARDGHYHLIKAGTVTERSAGHSHRFSAIDSLIHHNLAA